MLVLTVSSKYTLSAASLVENCSAFEELCGPYVARRVWYDLVVSNQVISRAAVEDFLSGREGFRLSAGDYSRDVS